MTKPHDGNTPLAPADLEDIGFILALLTDHLETRSDLLMVLEHYATRLSLERLHHLRSEVDPRWIWPDPMSPSPTPGTHASTSTSTHA